jgi:TonB family protein
LGVTASSAFAGHPIHFEATAEMDVPAQGPARIVQVFDIERAARNEAVQTRLKQEIAQRIAGWEFQPAQIGGTTVDTHTFVRVRMEAQINDDDSFTVRVLDANTGPRTRYRVFPAYPKAAVKAHAEGYVILLLEVGPKGEVVSAITEKSDTSPGSGAMRNAFEAVAEQSVKLWRFQNEVVNGQPVSARVRVPVKFCMNKASSWCGKLPDTVALELTKELATLDPAAKLLTDVSEKDG